MRTGYEQEVWVWLTKRGKIVPYGNGHGQFQYPIFDRKAEAKQWHEQTCGNPGHATQLVKARLTWVSEHDAASHSEKP